MYVPFANQALLATALPTSHGYLPPPQRAARPQAAYFADLFAQLGTADDTPYLAVPAAIKVRADLCGGESLIRLYCTRLARQGGDIVASMLGTDVLDNRAGTLRDGCAFANVRLPITVTTDNNDDGNTEDGGSVPAAEVDRVLRWLLTTAVHEFDTYLQSFYYAGHLWTRLSAQVYLDLPDFVWAATTLRELSARARRGEWRTFEDAVSH